MPSDQPRAQDASLAPTAPATVTTHRPGGAAAPPGSAGRAPGCHRRLCLPPPARDPGGPGCSWRGIRRVPPHSRGEGTPPNPALTLAMAAEAISSAAQSRGLSLAISVRERCGGEHPLQPKTPPGVLFPLPCWGGGVAQQTIPLRSSLAGFPCCKRFLLLDVTNAFSSSAREMYCPTCPQPGGCRE